MPIDVYFPYDFGMLENTHAKDGDPADTMLITESIPCPGVRLTCRIIGALHVKQNKKAKSVRNGRYFAAAVINYAKEENERFFDVKLINASK